MTLRTRTAQSAVDTAYRPGERPTDIDTTGVNQVTGTTGIRTVPKDSRRKK